jgi:transaldolase
VKATQQLHDAGQSLWIDDITRDMLDSGRLGNLIAELSVTGLTSNPTIFEKAIAKGGKYDDAIQPSSVGLSEKSCFRAGAR